jgi:dTDP-4-amino-4,6-dideoxygalactose transaminase
LKGKSLCLVPSFTFVATIHAIRNAGLEPLLADISPLTLALSPDYVRELDPDVLDRLAAIVVVSPFGAPLDLAAWEELSIQTGIPVVVDAAAAITALPESSKIPVCVSLHATKTLAIGEGGAVISSDEGLISSITQQTSFGFAPGNNESMIFGGNYRLSEYSCAIGIAALDQIAQKEVALFEVASSYIRSIKNSGKQAVRLQDGFGDKWVSSTINLILSPETYENTIANLGKGGIPWRRWWGLGAGSHHAFKNCSALSLEATEEISRRVVGVPFYIGISDSDIDSVVECISR